MKKLKQFLFIFVPLLLVIAIQFLATYFAMGLSLLIENGWYSVTGSAGFLDIVDDAFSLWSSQRFNTGVLLIYNAMSIAVFGLPVWRQLPPRSASDVSSRCNRGHRHADAWHTVSDNLYHELCRVALSALDGCIRIPARDGRPR